MKLRSLTIENFRSFKEPITIDELRDVNVFIGANNVGKSNILEALRYIQAKARGAQLRNYKELVFDGLTDKDIHIALSFSPSPNERKDVIKTLFQDNPWVRVDEIIDSGFLSKIIVDLVLANKRIVQEEIRISNIVSGELVIVKNSIKANSLARERVNLADLCQKTKFENIPASSVLQSRSAPAPAGILLVEGMDPMPMEYELVLKMKERMEKGYWFQPIRQAQAHLPLGEQSQLDSAGQNLVRFLFTLQNNNPDEYARIMKEFLKIVPEMQKVSARLSGADAIVTMDENSLSSLRDLDNVSSGLMQTLILVAGILSIKSESLFLIEEPEIHLHANSQRRLFDLIRREAKNRQFFITTHSTIFSACDEKTSTYLVTKRNGASDVRRIQETEDFKLVKECLGHRNSDLFGDECIVFVEGDSEENAFPIIAKSLGIDFRAKGIRLINIKGKSKATKLYEYLRYLRDSDVISYVIADGDKKLKDQLEDWQREGIIMPYNWTIWDLEFEDCFAPDFIAKIVNEMYREQGIELNLNPEQLSQKDANTSMVKILKRILHEQDLDLDKPELAERIAFALAENIGKDGHKETAPEIEIKKIVRLVDKDFLFSDSQKNVKREKAYNIAEIRQRYPRAYEKWAVAEDNELTEKYQEGLSISQLAEHFQRKEGAIRSRLRKLGLEQ